MWDAQVGEWDSPFAFHYSQEWFDLRRQPHVIDGNRPVLAVLCDVQGRPTGIVPVEFCTREISLRLFRDFAIHLQPSTTMSLLFGNPAFSLSADALDALFQCLAENFPSCPVIRIEGVPSESLVASHVTDSRKIRSEFLVYPDESNNWIHTIPLPGNFAEYLGRYSSKKRYNLPDSFAFLPKPRVTHSSSGESNAPDDVPQFLKSLEQLATASTSSSSAVKRKSLKPPPRLSPDFVEITHELAAQGLMQAICSCRASTLGRANQRPIPKHVRRPKDSARFGFRRVFAGHGFAIKSNRGSDRHTFRAADQSRFWKRSLSL